MKRLIICIGIMSSIVIFSLWGIVQINALRKDFDSLISKSESLVLQRDSANAQRHLKEFTNDWDNMKNKLSYVCVKTDLKEISELISQLEFELYTSPESYFQSCLELRIKISNLFESEIPDFNGVF